MKKMTYVVAAIAGLAALQASANIVPMPGVMSLGVEGATNAVNFAVEGTYIYGRNSVVMTNVAGVLQVRTGANTFDAVSLGKGNASTSHATDHSFAVSAGDLVSFYFDYKAVAAGTPTFSIRLNEGTSAQGERINVTVATTDLGGGVTRYSLADYLVPQPAGSETVDRMDVFISFGNTQGFARSTYVGDIVGAYVIPEPATLGMVAAMGGLALFIRRRFMM